MRGRVRDGRQRRMRRRYILSNTYRDLGFTVYAGRSKRSGIRYPGTRTSPLLQTDRYNGHADDFTHAVGDSRSRSRRNRRILGGDKQMKLTVANDHIARTGLPFPISLSGLGANAVAGGTIPPTNSPCYNPSDWFPHMLGYAGADENACLDLPQNQPPPPNLTPVLTALTPGVPQGYDWNTGQVPITNTTGATTPVDPTALANAWDTVRASIPADPNSCAGESWYCTLLGIGCTNPACASTGGTPGLTQAVLAVGAILLGIVLIKK